MSIHSDPCYLLGRLDVAVEMFLAGQLSKAKLAKAHVEVMAAFHAPRRIDLKVWHNLGARKAVLSQARAAFLRKKIRNADGTLEARGVFFDTEDGPTGPELN